jgi:hypothetical protein
MERSFETLRSMPQAPQLPAAVQAMMFPQGNTPRAPILAHPGEAAPAISPQANLPPEIARHLPTPPIEGLHDISPIVDSFCVTKSVSAPVREEA